MSGGAGPGRPGSPEPAVPGPGNSAARSRAGRSSVLKPALLLTSGRTLAFGASFFIPVVLARVFSTAEFGTYKQLFLLIMTLYFTVQLGIANSLYYFVPREPERAGRFVANALAVLAAAGTLCAAVLIVERDALAWLFSNRAVPVYAAGVAAYLVLMLLATPLEIVMIARRRHRSATLSYALSDVVRAGLLIVPTLVTGELFWMMAGAVAYALARFGVAAAWLRRELRGELRLDRSLLRRQLAYSLPFGLAVVVITVQADLHQYVVAHTFDAATFAIYAVGCLQIPLVDFIATPTGDVMMVRMAEELRDGDAEAARMTWHDAMGGLALLLFPLVGGLLLLAPELIVLLFTADYAASVPIFMLWTTMILFAPLLVDGVLRVYARTRLLLGLSVVQLALIGALIVPFLSWFGLPGAVLATVLALATARIAGLVRIRRLLGLPLSRLLPWRTLALIAAAAVLAYAAGRAVKTAAELPDLPSMLLAGAVYATTYAALTRRWGVAPDPRPALRRALGKLAPRLAGS